MLKAKKLKGYIVILLLIGFGMYVSLWVLHPYTSAYFPPTTTTNSAETISSTTIMSLNTLVSSMDTLQSTLKEMETGIAVTKNKLRQEQQQQQHTQAESNSNSNPVPIVPRTTRAKEEEEESQRVTVLKNPTDSIEERGHVHPTHSKAKVTPVAAVAARPDLRNLPTKTLQLLSLNKPTQSDVRGNLGPVSVIVNENVQDWLKDRWQTAKNMQGEPIPGEHWVTIDLLDSYVIRKVVIDWEQAYSDQWTLLGRNSEYDQWKAIAIGMDAFTSKRDKMHIIQEIIFGSLNDQEIVDDPQRQLIGHRQQKMMQAIDQPIRYVKLLIHRPSTRWGSSIWRLQVWGY